MKENEAMDYVNGGLHRQKLSCSGVDILFVSVTAEIFHILHIAHGGLI